MSADVVGYSRLMGMDEAGTLSRLNSLRRELIDPAIASHSGRIVTRRRLVVSQCANSPFARCLGIRLQEDGTWTMPFSPKLIGCLHRKIPTGQIGARR